MVYTSPASQPDYETAGGSTCRPNRYYTPVAAHFNYFKGRTVRDTTDTQWLIETAAQTQKDADSYTNAAFFAALQTFVAKQAQRRTQYTATIHGRSTLTQQW